MMLSPIVVGLFWKFMLDVQFGVVNSFLDSLGLGRVEWLTRQRLALFSLIIVDTWQWTPFIMLIALAGLTAVPKYLYEAAEIDRASEWFKFRRITFPLVWPLLLIAVMFRAIEAFRLFDLVYILTRPVLEVHARRPVRRRELVPRQPRARPGRMAHAAAKLALLSLVVVDTCAGSGRRSSC